MSAWEQRRDLARRLAREAARGGQALVRLCETTSTRWQAATRSLGAPSLVKTSTLLTVRVAGPRGVGSAEAWLPREGGDASAAIASARALARIARDGGSLEGALAGLEPVRFVDAAALEVRPAALLRALELAIASRHPSGVFLDATFDTMRSVFAFAGLGAERLHASSIFQVKATGEVHVETPRGLVTAPFAFAQGLRTKRDRDELLRFARAAGRDALARARSRARSHPFAKKTALALLSPEIVAWFLQGPLLEGFALARKGSAAGLPRWLAVTDLGPEIGLSPGTPDEQGLMPSPQEIVRDGRWARGPFQAFDGTGRTRRDGKTGEARAHPGSLVVTAAGGRAFVRPFRELERRAELVLGEVASADPLPGGGVFMTAPAAARLGGRSRATGLLGIRFHGSELARRVVAVSREREPVLVQEVPIVVPWVLVRGLRVTG